MIGLNYCYVMVNVRLKKQLYLFRVENHQFISEPFKRQSQLLSSALSSACDFKSHFCKQSDLGPHCLPVCKNRFEKFARIFSRRHKQTTFSDAVFLWALRVKLFCHMITKVRNKCFRPHIRYGNTICIFCGNLHTWLLTQLGLTTFFASLIA